MNHLTVQQASWNGVRVEYTDSGLAPHSTDPTLVLVHGLGGSRRHFDRVVARWTASRVLAVDLPGFGGSEPCGRGVTVDDLAHAVVAVLDHAQVGSVLLVGHSMSGPIGLRYAALDGDRVSGVVLLAGTVQTFTATLGRSPKPWLKAPTTAFAALVELISVCLPVPSWLRKLLSRSRVGRMLVLWPFVQHPARLARGDAELLLAGAGAKGAWPTARALGRLGEWDTRQAPRCPLYAINGRADRIAPVADLEAVRLPLAARFILESGHMVMMERTDELIAILEEVHSAVRA